MTIGPSLPPKRILAPLGTVSPVRAGASLISTARSPKISIR
jgi:hypothetical protein